MHKLWPQPARCAVVCPGEAVRLPAVVWRRCPRGWWVGLFCLALLVGGAAQQLVRTQRGWRGGTLRVVESSEPRTLNPIFATDNVSRLVCSLTQADLLHINAATQKLEPALATSVEHRDALHWLVHLRHGVRFSDGVPLTAADVVFSFQIYTDAHLQAPQRDLLVQHGQVVSARALDANTVELTLPGPIAVGDRMLDSLWILPRHLLQPIWASGKLASSWALGTATGHMAGAGAFRVSGWQPGRSLTLARNAYYWQKSGQGVTLPFLDAVMLEFVGEPSVAVSLLTRGQVDALSGLRPEEFGGLQASRCCHVWDAGAALEPLTLIFNQAAGKGPGWLRAAAFRHAVSMAIDRENLVRNVYGGRASVLSQSLAGPSDGPWYQPAPPPRANLTQARDWLRQAGLRAVGSGWQDAAGHAVRFSLIVPGSNAERRRVAGFVAEDLRQIGIPVTVVPLDFGSYVQRLVVRGDYEAALLAFGFPDSDPNVEASIWELDGRLHLWNPRPGAPMEWERQLDALFRRQNAAHDPGRRLHLYRQMQALEAEQLPLIPLLTPHILAATAASLRNVQVGVLAPHLLFDAQVLSWPAGGRR